MLACTIKVVTPPLKRVLPGCCRGWHRSDRGWFCSVSTALDEAATALTRMKSEKQTYEAFLRGANQAPSPHSAPAPSNQQQPSSSVPSHPPAPSVALATSIPSGSGKGGGAGGGKMPTQQKGMQQPSQQQLVPSQQNQQPLDGMQTVQRLLTQGTKGEVQGFGLGKLIACL